MVEVELFLLNYIGVYLTLYSPVQGKHFKNHDNFIMLMYVVDAQQLLSNHSISDILWSLCDIAMETEQQLRKDTSSIDLQRDTQQLKCVFVVCIFPAIFYVCVSVHVSLCCRCVCVWLSCVCVVCT